MIKSKYKFSEIFYEDDGQMNVRDNIRLIVDCVYESRKPYVNLKDHVLHQLMKVGTQGGIRVTKDEKNNEYKYIVLYSNKRDINWNDRLDTESGILEYYGDNRVAGQNIHDKIGNKALEEIFRLATSKNIEDRYKIPPVFFFEKEEGNDVVYRGLLVPGTEIHNENEWLVAEWYSTAQGDRFQNYKALFTVINTNNDKGFDDGVSIKWIDSLNSQDKFNEDYCPLNWKIYVEKQDIIPLLTKRVITIPNKDDQTPTNILEMKILDVVYEYFKEDPFLFEEFAIKIVELMDKNVIQLEGTRNVKDGGRDGIGLYSIGKKYDNSRLDTTINVEFALEAKCYDISKSSVGVRETSRLISRIKNRQFGILVTTSYVANQAFSEIIEDKHPIMIITGKTISQILIDNNINTIERVSQFLVNNFKKDVQ